MALKGGKQSEEMVAGFSLLQQKEICTVELFPVTLNWISGKRRMDGSCVEYLAHVGRDV